MSPAIMGVHLVVILIPA